MVNFDEKLAQAETPDDIKKMKTWMFQEQVRIQTQKDELYELSKELHNEKRAYEVERNALNRRIKAEEKRFEKNEMLISRKQQILEEGFRQLAIDKKVLECERLNFEYEKGRFKKQRTTNVKPPHVDTNSAEGNIFFRGISSELALRKRYKELLKIFHPDNVCGDTNTLLRIQEEYESMKKKYYEA